MTKLDVARGDTLIYIGTEIAATAFFNIDEVLAAGPPISLMVTKLWSANDLPDVGSSVPLSLPVPLPRQWLLVRAQVT